MMHPRGRPRRLGRGKAWHYAAFATVAAGMLAAGGVGFASGGVSSGTSNDTWSLTLGSMTTTSISSDGYLSGTESAAATLTGSSTTESSSSTVVLFQPNITVQITVPSTVADVSSNTYELNATETMPSGIPSGVTLNLWNLVTIPAGDDSMPSSYDCPSEGHYAYISSATDCGAPALSTNPTLITGSSPDPVSYNWSAFALFMVIPASTTIPVGQYTGAVTITGVLNSAASN